MIFAKNILSCFLLMTTVFTTFTSSNTYTFFSNQNLTFYPTYLLNFQESVKLLKLRPLKDFLEYATNFQLKIVDSSDIKVLCNLHKENYIYFKIICQLQLGDVDFTDNASVDDFILGSYQDQDLFLSIQLYLNDQPRSIGNLNLKNGLFYINSFSNNSLDSSIFRSAKIDLRNLISIRDLLLLEKEALLDRRCVWGGSLFADKESQCSEISPGLYLDFSKLSSGNIDDEFIPPQTKR